MSGRLQDLYERARRKAYVPRPGHEYVVLPTAEVERRRLEQRRRNAAAIHLVHQAALKT